MRMVSNNLPPSSDVKSELEERLHFETLLANISSDFVNLPVDKIDREIESVLKRIAEVLDIDRCSVAQLNEDRSKLRVTHGYAVPGVAPMPDIILDDNLPWYKQQLSNCEPILLTSIDDLPKDASHERMHLLQGGIQSTALIPLHVGGTFLGAVGFAALKMPRQWPDSLIQRLKLLSEIFANTLERKRKEQDLLNAIQEISELKEKLEAENNYLREEIQLQYLHEEIIGQSSPMKNVLKLVEQVAKMDTTVLILGETGTGKELIAHAIHSLSPRNKQPQITVNCGALPEHLIESELFGHEKGAFTGADLKRIGRFEVADGSTIFLDEIGELSLALQVKLLRVLQQKQFERLGSQKTIETDVRVIAATNRDLLESVNKGEFRADLFYRLNVFPIVVPPLRDRQEDIPTLVFFFLKHFCKKMDKQIDNISKSTMNSLYNHKWPGNVRELKNTIERAVIITPGNTLQIELQSNQPTTGNQLLTFEEGQRQHILRTLKHTSWRIRGQHGAAEILGLKPTTLESKMAKLGIIRPNR